MGVQYCVYDPVEERMEWFDTRDAAEKAARDMLSSAQYEAGFSGWPESIEDLAVYECRPLLVVREAKREDAVKCPEERESHANCETCEGTRRVDAVTGEPWSHGGDYDFVCDYELFAPDPSP